MQHGTVRVIIQVDNHPLDGIALSLFTITALNVDTRGLKVRGKERLDGQRSCTSVQNNLHFRSLVRYLQDTHAGGHR